jgi:FtsK/SpoIIIE family
VACRVHSYRSMRTRGQKTGSLLGSGCSKHVRQDGGKAVITVKSWKRLGMAAGLVASALVVAASLVGCLGAPGEAAEYVIGGLLGWTAWLVVLELGLGAWLVGRGRDFSAFRVFGDSVIIVALASFTRLAFGRWSGLLGTLFGESAKDMFGEFGAVLVGLGLVGLVLAERLPIGKRAVAFARGQVRTLTASSTKTLAQVKVQVREIADAEIVSSSDSIPAVLQVPSSKPVTTSSSRSRVKASLDCLNEGALRSMLGSEEFKSFASKAALPIVLGRDSSGNAMFGDLAAMPHVLMSGASGSGKSVGLSVMLASLLHARSARDIQLVLVDPKVVEFSVFNGIAHLQLPVATEVDQAQAALDWCVTEMNRRFDLLAKAGARNIDSYNAKSSEKLSRIVVIVDEFADLVMSQKKGDKSIETAVVRLGQKARAAGLHVILATQRPSVNVISGIIKANFSSRIAYRTSSQVDSRTILDEAGAEILLGKGDSLVRLNGEAMRRVQCPLISEVEIDALAASLKISSRSSRSTSTSSTSSSFATEVV